MKNDARKHTPEPWKVDPLADPRCLSIREDRPDSYLIATVWKDDTPGLMEADARRIVACVNACEGIPVEFLEAVGSGRVPIGPILPLYDDDDRLQGLAADRFAAIAKAVRRSERNGGSITEPERVTAAIQAAATFAAALAVGTTRGSSGDLDVDISSLKRVRQAALRAMIDELAEIEGEEN